MTARPPPPNPPRLNRFVLFFPIEDNNRITTNGSFAGVFWAAVGRYQLTFYEAQRLCEILDATLASYNQLYKAWETGMEQCKYVNYSLFFTKSSKTKSEWRATTTTSLLMDFIVIFEWPCYSLSVAWEKRNYSGSISYCSLENNADISCEVIYRQDSSLRSNFDNGMLSFGIFLDVKKLSIFR